MLKEKIDPTESNKHKVVKSVFEDANNYMKSGNLVLAVIEKIEDSISGDCINFDIVKSPWCLEL